MSNQGANPVAIVNTEGGISREEAIALVNGIRQKAGLEPLSAERIAASDARLAAGESGKG